MGKLLCLLCLLSFSALAADVPKEKPVTATAFGFCEDGEFLLVGMVISYKDGSVVRFGEGQMRGFKSAKELMEYGKQATDKDVFTVGDCEPLKPKKLEKGQDSV